jgi:hypothetical protein
MLDPWAVVATISVLSCKPKGEMTEGPVIKNVGCRPKGAGELKGYLTGL